MLLAALAPLKIVPEWWSILPPLIAITLAIVTKRIYLSLATGILVAIILLGRAEYLRPEIDDSKARPTSAAKSKATGKENKAKTKAERPHDIQRAVRYAVTQGAESHIWKQLADSSHLRVFVFTLMMGGMVGVLYRSGAMLGLVVALSPLARSRRGGQIVTWLLGLIVFFDDYANSLLLGNTMRPLADRLKISREKLAYIVDSTAAPVSGLALISTWVAGEISYISDGLQALTKLTDAPAEVTGTAFAIFVQTIPYRFYVLLALLFVPIVAWMRRDLPSMHRAEIAALEGEAETNDRAAADDMGQSGKWYDAVVPIVAVVGVTLWLILETGRLKTDKPDATLFDVFGNGDSYIALVYGSLSGLLTAMLIARSRGHAAADVQAAVSRGCLQVVPALTILWLSWVLSGLTQELKTGQYLSDLIKQSQLPTWLLPTAVFILSSLVAFSTGTSWGTMSILVPLVVQIGYGMLTDAGGTTFDATQPIMLAAVGSVLAGAIFGDHCSPISDTTILSSQASGCDHIQHVRTQMPYALLVGGVSIVLGTIPAALGISPWVLLPLGIGTLVFLLRVLGKPLPS